MRLSVILAASLALAACATPAPSAPAAPTCTVSAEDRVWIDASLGAWQFTAREISGVATVQPFQAVFFDDDCALTSADAFSAEHASDVTWIARPHAGQVQLPTGDLLPAGVAAFASADGEAAFLVMSTPSVWRAAGVNADPFGLEAMMTAVLLHEGSHVAQASTYGARMSALVAAHGLPDDFNDDSIQERFAENAEFSASVEREIDLLFRAAAAPDQATARALAREARDFMQARRARWFSGDDAYLTEAEDIWLSFEGSAQWLGYQWMVHPAGGDVDSAAAMSNFARRGRWWTQKQGVALAFVVDRLAPFDWKAQAFGSGGQTLTAMLDAALASEE